MNNLVMSIDQSISNTAWNLFKDGEVIAFGSFGSKAGTKKAEKGCVVFHETIKFLDEEEYFFEQKVVKKDETDIFQRVSYSGRCFEEITSHITTHYGNIEHFVFENLAFGAKGNATRDVAGLLFSIVKDLDFGIYSLVAPTSAKKIFSGDGRASKLDMINTLPKEIRQMYLDAGFRYTPKGEGTLNDLADSYSFYQWYLQQ